MSDLRKTKEDKPVVAICYDFDKTLSPDDMQAQGYIQSVYKGDISEFWKESNGMAEQNEMDTNLAYMYKMIKEARGKILLTRSTLKEYGSRIQLFPGVEDWFERIRDYGLEHDVIIEHYIISSGLKEMIEGTVVAEKGVFEKIYASSFLFDDDDVPIWPAQVVNYTNKTQFLFRIEKGVLDVFDSGVNEFFPPEELRVPFRNMVYIGDSDTDIPCMKLVNTYGGHSIGVYNNDTLDKSKIYKMFNDNRIKYFAPADYRKDSKLDQLIKSIIESTAKNEVVETFHFDCKREWEKITQDQNRDSKKKDRLNLILSLNGSRSFSTTHLIVKDMLLVEDWEKEELNMIMDVALSNTQVLYILNDPDVKAFYQKVLGSLPEKNDKAQEIKKHLE